MGQWGEIPGDPWRGGQENRKEMGEGERIEPVIKGGMFHVKISEAQAQGRAGIRL